MRRLIFCFDGTWNSLGGVPTNVVLTAASIKPRSHDNISQVIYYDEEGGTALRQMDRLPTQKRILKVSATQAMPVG
jgi:uncharacterized protein (DUF2235 family)